MFKAIVKTVFLFLLILVIYLIPSPISADDVTGSTTASVSVPPRAIDLQLSTSLNPDYSTYAQNEDFEIQITYGSSLTFAAPMTIVGQWSQGTIQGQSYPSIDVLDYVTERATTAYGSTQPVIDTVNRTVTWTISSFPAKLTDQTVSFRLRTNSSYTASQNVSFTIGAYLTDSETTVNATDITRNYLYNYSRPVPTSSLTPTGSPAPTPTPQAFAIKTIAVRSISDKDATIYIATNQKSENKITYGASIKSLNQSVEDNFLDLEHIMTLSGLIPDTKYYFKVFATDQNNKIVASDIFSVKTAGASEAPIIAANTFIVTSSNKVLVAPVNPALEKITDQEQKTLVIPQSIIYDLRFSFVKNKPIKSIKVVLRKKKMVLGINTLMLAQVFNLNNQDSEEAIQQNPLEVIPLASASNVNVKEVGLTEIQPGIFSGRLISSLPIGEYDLFAVITDNDGNISETKLSNVKVVNLFTALSKETREPIEAARIYLSFYNSSTKRYEPLLPTLISITNPSFTDSYGKSPIVLPQGKYKALVSDLGYKDKTIDFVIGIGENDGFPIVFLEKEGFNLWSTLTYYGRSIRDVYIYYTMQYFTALSKSLRFFNLINALSLGLFVVVTFLSFKFRTHIPLRSILSYFIYHIRKISGQNMSAFYLEGTVRDDKTKTPIGKAQVYLVDGKTHQTIRQTSTNINGHFFFKLNKHEDYEILTVKKGYEITPHIEAEAKTYEKTPINISLKQSETKIGLFNIILAKLIEMPIGFLFEYLLISSLISEIASIPYFGFQRTLPFLAISTFNLFLWILHLKQKSQSRKPI